jgi:hypothetical protein
MSMQASEKIKPGSLSHAWKHPFHAEPASPLSILPCLLNIKEYRIAGLGQGFGQHWEKIYETRLPGIDVRPEDLVELWKERFVDFWPEGNIFFSPVEGIQNGAIALLKLAIPGQSWPFIATGVVVEEVTTTSFTYTALSGHPIAGSMAFRAYRDDDGVTVAQAHASLRASDPLYELAMRVSGDKEDAFWRATLRNLALQFGSEGEFRQKIRRVDSHLRWSKWTNIFRNAAIRSTLYYLTYPIRLLIFYLRALKRSTP